MKKIQAYLADAGTLFTDEKLCLQYEAKNFALERLITFVNGKDIPDSMKDSILTFIEDNIEELMELFNPDIFAVFNKTFNV